MDMRKALMLLCIVFLSACSDSGSDSGSSVPTNPDLVWGSGNWDDKKWK